MRHNHRAYEPYSLLHRVFMHLRYETVKDLIRGGRVFAKVDEETDGHYRHLDEKG